FFVHYASINGSGDSSTHCGTDGQIKHYYTSNRGLINSQGLSSFHRLSIVFSSSFLRPQDDHETIDLPSNWGVLSLLGLLWSLCFPYRTLFQASAESDCNPRPFCLTFTQNSLIGFGTAVLY